MTEVVPVTRDQCRAFIRNVHRHNPNPPAAEVLRVGLAIEGKLVAVGIAGRPLARAYCDGRTIEVTRLAVDDVPNGCSQLYGALWRAARALGYRRAVTYTRDDESGASLRAAGWTADAVLEPRNRVGWDNRPGRVTAVDAVRRVRWMVHVGPQQHRRTA